MAAVNGTNMRVVMTKRQCSCDENEKIELTTEPDDSILFI